MSATINPIHEDYKAGIPYLCIKDADDAIEFYTQVFDAVVVRRFAGPNGKSSTRKLRLAALRL